MTNLTCICDAPYRSIIGQPPCSVSDQNCTDNSDCNITPDGNGGGSCDDGTHMCNCFKNWKDGSSQCNIDISCNNYNAKEGKCGNGQCNLDNGVCECDPGFYSLNSTCDTYNYPCKDNTQCGAGTCDSGQCNCRYGWTTTNIFCDTCSNDDSYCGNGNCQSGMCQCSAGWLRSSTLLCDKVDLTCNSTSLTNQCNNGDCLNDSCSCYANYTSVSSPCDTLKTCGNSGYSSDYCGANGSCTINGNGDAVCICNTGYYGTLCDTTNPCDNNSCTADQVCYVTADLSNFECLSSSTIVSISLFLAFMFTQIV